MKLRLSYFLTFQILFILLIVSSKASAATVTSFTDDFEAEGTSLNYNSFAKWDVIDGTVDTIATGGFGINCPSGSSVCVDLDGSTADSGILTTKDEFDVGTYTLSFDISGNQRGQAADTVTVILGDYIEQFSRESGDPWETITRSVDVTSLSKLSFENEGGDNFGIILDNVSVAVVPIPAAAWLFVSGFAGLLFSSRRKATA